MRIISWNCNGALRKKLSVLDALNADLLCIQECEDPAQSTQAYREWAGDYLWRGTNKNKGIGVFAKSKNKIKALSWSAVEHDNTQQESAKKSIKSAANLQTFLPFTLNNKHTVLACWTKQNQSKNYAYMGQFWKYLQIHKNKLDKKNTLIIGDFNSNKIWDNKNRNWSHSGTIAELSAINIVSLYHHQSGEQQGQETQATFYLYKNLDKPYHIDYAFMSKHMLTNSSLTLGQTSDWLEFSDHLPLCINIKT